MKSITVQVIFFFLLLLLHQPRFVNLSLQSGKDLVQEVAKLRRSLDDAEGLSRDTKKEWAVLRSQNISLEETMVSPQKSPDNLLETAKMKIKMQFGCQNMSL